MTNNPAIGFPHLYMRTISSLPFVQSDDRIMTLNTWLFRFSLVWCATLTGAMLYMALAD
jgi:hypothetical protein